MSGTHVTRDFGLKHSPPAQFLKKVLIHICGRNSSKPLEKRNLIMMNARIVPLTMVELMYLLTTGKEKLATELVTELRIYETTNQRKS